MKKIINLCSSCKACPMIEIDDKEVRIGEGKNFCVLKKEEWEILKKKIKKDEI